MQPLAIVVPVYNDFEGLQRCLAALARWRPADSTLVLVNDASTDARVLPKLREFEAAHPRVQVIAVIENGGFIASANRGAAAAPAEADLLFLNADTQVTEGWADEMRGALDAFPNAAVCCPLSNNATILSVPQFQQENSLPFDWDADRMARFVRDCAGALRAVPIPTPVGFCMLVRRDAWDRFGPFDPAFGRGYGEEDDFGQRVQAAGLAVICASRAFVYHQGTASFASVPGLAEQRRANNRLLLSRWPDYDEKTRAWCQSNPLRPLHEKIWRGLLTPPGMRPFHVLHLVKQWQLEGPLRSNVTEIVDATQDFAIHTVLVPTPERGAWLDAIDFESEHNLRVVGLIELEKRLDRFLEASPADLVHIHGGGGWLPADLVERTRAKLPVLLTPGEILDPARCAEMYRRVQA